MMVNMALEKNIVYASADLFSKILCAKEQNKYAGALFIDLSKAFNCYI